MARKVNVIHFGAFNEDIANHLAPEFQYFADVTPKTSILNISFKPIFEREVFNRDFRNAIVLVDAPEEFMNTKWFVSGLPANNIIVSSALEFSEEEDQILRLKNAQFESFTDGQAIAAIINSDFFQSQFGYKKELDQLTINSGFSGTVQRDGNVKVNLQGTFGDDFREIISWKDRITYLSGRDWITEIELYPEIHLGSEVEAYFKLYLWDYQHDRLIETMQIEVNNQMTSTKLERKPGVNVVAVSLFAKGRGSISVGQLHIRGGRHNRGNIVVGGDVIRDPKNRNEELFYYFNAGDLKPPLNVYFSGYRTAEGYEAIPMINEFGAPFLVFADPRLEGGAFYMGSPELEAQVVEIIQATLAKLGFDKSDLILAGISMGTFAATYYSVQLDPHAVIIAKPLMNLGNIAINERVNRPQNFPTSYDVLMKSTKGTNTAEAAEQLNQKVWKHFKSGQFKNTTFIVAYMLDDDYDNQTFGKLSAVLKEKFPTTRLISKGIIGRHNDDTSSVVKWFKARFSDLMTADFNR